MMKNMRQDQLNSVNHSIFTKFNSFLFKNVTLQAMKKIWSLRSNLDLVGNTFNIHTGKWVHANGGIGAGIDSFYEYLLKGYILLGNEELYSIYNQSVTALRTHLKRKGWYMDGNIQTGTITKQSIDSLQAFWPALQVLAGDLDEAIQVYNKFYKIWKKYGFLPEGYDIVSNQISIPGNQKTSFIFFRN